MNKEVHLPLYPNRYEITVSLGTFSTLHPSNAKDKDWLLKMLEHDRDSADAMAWVEIKEEKK